MREINAALGEDGMNWWSRTEAVCFTRLKDRLSQWRGYGASGVAIGVDPQNLVAVSPEVEFDLRPQFEPMQYGEDGIDRVTARIRGLGWHPSKSHEHQHEGGAFEDRLRAEAQRALFTLKDDGFSEEEEVRLMFTTPNSHGAEIHVTQGSHVTATGLLVPHIEVPIHLEAIKEIWVGPGVHMRLNAQAMRRAIDAAAAERRPVVDAAAAQEFFYPDILASTTPYR